MIIDEEKQTQRSSQNTVPAERLFYEKKRRFTLEAVINKTRVLQGWNLLDPQEMEVTVSVWMDSLDRYGIDPRFYLELLDLATQHRINSIVAGRAPMNYSPELFILVWNMQQAERRKTLPTLAEHFAMIEHYRRDASFLLQPETQANGGQNE